MSIGVTILIALLFGLSYLVTPLMFVWGWNRWTQGQKSLNISSIFSLVGFILATFSALLAVLSIAYAQDRRFGYYDPTLMKVFRWGCLLSIGGFLFGIGGAWRKGPLRWLSPVCALGTFAFWILAAAGE
jgi:hypothetical protein